MTGSGRGGGGGRGGGYPIYPLIGPADPGGGVGGNLCITPGKVAAPVGGICCRGDGGGGVGGGGWYAEGCAAPIGGLVVATVGFNTGVEGFAAAD